MNIPYSALRKAANPGSRAEYNVITRSGLQNGALPISQQFVDVAPVSMDTCFLAIGKYCRLPTRAGSAFRFDRRISQ
jgi:hypothetical protein